MAHEVEVDGRSMGRLYRVHATIEKQLKSGWKKQLYIPQFLTVAQGDPDDVEKDWERHYRTIFGKKVYIYVHVSAVE